MKNRYIELALSGLRESQGYMTKGTDQYHETEEAIQYFESELQQLEGRERFKKPTEEQVIKLAILFNNGNLDQVKLSYMIAMSEFIIDRLYENGDISIPSSKEAPELTPNK